MKHLGHLYQLVSIVTIVTNGEEGVFRCLLSLFLTQTLVGLNNLKRLIEKGLVSETGVAQTEDRATVLFIESIYVYLGV